MLLEGIRVVDLTRLLPGPYATLRLADMGATVIKIEAADGGDPARYMSQQLGGTGVVFLANNRSKQSVALDLKTEAGKAAALELMTQADVVIEGFRPRVAERLGIGYEAVKAVNPGVVYCSLTGFGQSGPLVEFGGHDINYMALSGMLDQVRDPSGRPVLPSMQFADLIGGIAASEAILAALVQRSQTGRGAYLDVAMTDALVGMLTNHALMQRAFGDEHGPVDLTGTRVCYNLYETSDGRMVSLGALEPKFWKNFCDALDRPDWLAHQYTPASADNPVYRQVEELFAQRSLDEWSEFASKADCCLQPVLRVSEAMASRYVGEKRLAAQVNTRYGDLLEVFTHAGGASTGWTAAVTDPPGLGDNRLTKDENSVK